MKRTVTKWTQIYGKSHNERRRERYKKDAAYRESIKAAKRERYARNSRPEPVTKEYNGRMHRVYRVGDIAERAGVDVMKVQNLVRSGKIPDKVFSGTHRYYSEAQVELILFAMSRHGMTADALRKYLDKRWLKGL
jgi:hypothetical protein